MCFAETRGNDLVWSMLVSPEAEGLRSLICRLAEPEANGLASDSRQLVRHAGGMERRDCELCHANRSFSARFIDQIHVLVMPRGGRKCGEFGAKLTELTY